MGSHWLESAKSWDRWLLAAVAVGIVLGAQGFGWGKYDCLNLDRMALRNVALKERPYLHPKIFVKPPFYTYLNHYLARVPADTVSKGMFWLDQAQRKQAYLLLRMGLARTLNLAFFAGSIILVFALVRHAFELPAARMAALLMATSAGFVPYQVFLTTDMALIFMMLASFACAVKIVGNPGMGISVAAGLLAGLAAATKYNGLIVAAALPVAHLLAGRGNRVLAALKRPAAWACGLCVPLGFLLGNPYAVLDWPTFSSDFLYNYKATPVYNGVTQGHGYEAFFWAFREILGRPGTWVVAAGAVAGIFSLATSRRKNGWQLWLLSAVVFVAYTWKIGDFPRVETRFVLPATVFALILGSAGFPLLLRARFLTVPVFAIVLAYNLACGWWVGNIFRKDPRMEALDFADKHLPLTGTVEISGSVPRVQDLPGRELKIIKIPTGIERDANFAKMFAGDGQMQNAMKRWTTKEGPEWFSHEARAARNPDWIFWSTIDLESVVRAQYEALFQKDSGYEVVFDGTSPEFPQWSYPRNTEFLRSRTTVWKKTRSSL
jgi:hypothetical protein